MQDHGLDEVPLWKRSFLERDAAIRHWTELTPLRDGPLNETRVQVPDTSAMAEDIKRRARQLGADDVA